MEGKVIVRAKIVRKPALLETLKALEVGVPSRFYSKDFKTQSIRSGACTLEKTKIYEFEVFEKDITDGCIVTRIK